MMEWILITWIMLTTVTVVTRLAPLAIGKWVKRQYWAGKLADQLPCMILVLLLIHDFEQRAWPFSTLTLAALLGLGATLTCHYFKRKTMLSITIGVLIYITATSIL